MIISTFNIQNNIKNYKASKTKEIYNYIKKNKIEIIGLQEVFSKCDNDLKDILNVKYNYVGKYRYFLKFIHPLKNEKNPIISKHEVLESKTYKLPSKNTKYKRIVTKCVIKYKKRLISVYNTHLEISNNEIKVKQLDKLFNIIKKDNNLIIIMGDFNLNSNNKLYESFKEKLKSIGIKDININTNTFKDSKDTIDHILVSNSFNVKSVKVLKNINFSDHYPVLIDISVL